jgi:hypothetical protein
VGHVPSGSQAETWAGNAMRKTSVTVRQMDKNERELFLIIIFSLRKIIFLFLIKTTTRLIDR